MRKDLLPSSRVCRKFSSSSAVGLSEGLSFYLAVGHKPPSNPCQRGHFQIQQLALPKLQDEKALESASGMEVTRAAHTKGLQKTVNSRSKDLGRLF